jgi:hypothetical protein
MPRLSIWDSGRKGADYNFFDKTISEFFGVGGTCAYIHLYTGPQVSSSTDSDTDSSTYTPPTATNPAPTAINQTSIQDVLLLENRDRSYSNCVYEMRGIYTISDVGFDLRQFGNFISADTLYIEFHFNDMISTIGRKLMAGDVIELPHQRDQYLLNGSQAINKFYVVEDASWASDGYSATWYMHIWRVQCTPMPATQEYQDILNAQAYNPLGQSQGATIGDLMSTMAVEMGINQQVWDAAVAQVPERYFETQQFWIVPGSETGSEYPWVFAGDGIPPNGAALAGQGTAYPESPNAGDYFLRTDFVPPTLFQWTGAAWVMQEVDWRQTWNVAHRLMESFINDTAIRTNDDGTTGNERTALSQAVTPQADF